MVTQYERDQIARAMRDRRLYALVASATEALDILRDEDHRRPIVGLLEEALEPYSIESLRRAVAWADEDAARRQKEADRIEAGKRAFAELPDAPPRRQCEVHVARDQGRWTDFGRCEKVATRIVMDEKNRRERCLCTVHATEFARGETPGTGFGRIGSGADVPTHESWYRIKGWCMAPDPAPADRRRAQRFCAVKVDQGTGRHEGKEHRFQ